MSRDGIASTNGRSKTYEALVKSLFTNISQHATEPEVPPRPQSRIGFRRNKPSKARSHPQQDRSLLHGEDKTNATHNHGGDSDEDTPDSETSDEWSTDSDTSDTPSSNDLRPCSAIPPTPPPILVPDAFPGQDLPSLSIQTDLPMHSPPPLRPIFPHHGLSRSALQHQKWLWNTRYDEWMQWRAEVETAAEAEMGPYGGISHGVAPEPPPPLRRPRVLSPMLAETEHPLVGKKAELNEKIFPRTGDITALHDPQVARLDQTFSNYPLCTIQKVLFVCSMDTAARGRSPPATASGKVDHHGQCQDTDAPRGMMKDVEPKTPAIVPDDLPTLESAMPLLTKLSWEQSWHTRWEVLTALVRMTEQAVLARGPTAIPATVTTPIGLPVVARSLADIVESSDTRVAGRFFLAGPEEPGVHDGGESEDDEEEDDYGEIVLNPRFGLQRPMTAERGLGHPFLHAPPVLPIDTRSGVKALRS